MSGAGKGRDGPVPSSDVSLLETVSRNVPIVLFSLDEAGVFTRSEGRGLAALGLEPNEAVGRSAFDVYADHPEIVDAVERALAGEDVNHVVELGEAAFEVWYRPVVEDGTVRVLGAGIDVTDRIRHERLLEQVNEAARTLVVADSEEEIADRIVEINRLVLDEPASVVWFFDPDDGILEPVDRTHFDLPESSPIQDLGDLTPIEPGTAEMEAFERGETAFFEDYASVENAAHPETTLGTILAVPMGDHGLITVGAEAVEDIGASTPDLVEILARDAAVALERVKHQSAVEQLHVATRELIEAESAEEIARRTVEAAEGILGHSQTVFRLLSGDGATLEPVAMSDWVRETIPDRPSYGVGEEPIGAVFEQGKPVRLHRGALGDRLANERTRSLLVLPVGDFGVLTIGDPDSSAFDESEMRLARVLVANAEAALDRIERREELRRQNERLEQFAGILSHDLRNPLNVVLGNLALAREDPSRIDAVEDAVGRMEAIIDDVLELTREGRAVTDPSSVKLSEAATRAWGTVRTNGATLEVVADAEIVADVDRLCRLLENLFRNSVEHGSTDPRSQAREDSVEHGSTGSRASSDDADEDGPAAPTVRIGAIEGGFFVEDDGTGVPTREREDVFEMGYSTGEGGTGLGLAIVEEICAAHGWSIALAEGAEGGARFEVTGVEGSAESE